MNPFEPPNPASPEDWGSAESENPSQSPVPLPLRSLSHFGGKPLIWQGLDLASCGYGVHERDLIPGSSFNMGHSLEDAHFSPDLVLNPMLVVLGKAPYSGNSQLSFLGSPNGDFVRQQNLAFQPATNLLYNLFELRSSTGIWVAVEWSFNDQGLEQVRQIVEARGDMIYDNP